MVLSHVNKGLINTTKLLQSKIEADTFGQESTILYDLQNTVQLGVYCINSSAYFVYIV